ncbi:Fic family protein [Methylococcus sp. Mc7]|nr:Fic family protein [Methylococcus sp. Mc7]
MDISRDKSGFEHCTVRVETQRFGPFTFCLGFDPAQIEVALVRVEDAHQRFDASPLAQVANQLEREVVVSSIFGTNSIEGGMLSEEETGAALALAPGQIRETEQRRAVNIKSAYDLARTAASTEGWHIGLDFIREVHAAITGDLPHPYNLPGQFRDNAKEIVTRVGDAAHGGIYKPPQSGADIRLLMQTLVDWHRQMEESGIPALIRAPLVHLYFEWIHPFWDGNGRVGRVLEATLLQAAGYRYAPFAMARYYHEHIDTYFALFNICRKSAEKRQAAPNMPFIDFHLEGMRIVINGLHDRVNRLITMLLFENRVKQLFDLKELNARQYTILTHLLNNGRPLPLAELRLMPWYGALYLKLNDKTRQRDLHKLRALELAYLDTENRLCPGFLAPAPVQPFKPSPRKQDDADPPAARR